jgi:hypothetical protein
MLDPRARAESVAVHIRNKHTRAAHARATDFLRWCEGQCIGEPGRVQPAHVAAYIEQLHLKWSAATLAMDRASPTLKQAQARWQSRIDPSLSRPPLC